MIVVRATTDIAKSLAQLVQAWIVSERTNNRLFVQWDSLPRDLVTIHPFFDATVNDTKGTTIYTPAIHREETNKHLLIYYYQRIFVQILVIKHPPTLPYAHKQIAVWGPEALKYLDTVSRHHWCKMKNVYRFGAISASPTPSQPGIVAPRYLDISTDTAESWSNLFRLMVCNVIIAPATPFIEIANRLVRGKELWIASEHGVVLQR
jgi:hypothetical protein